MTVRAAGFWLFSELIFSASLGYRKVVCANVIRFRVSKKAVRATAWVVMVGLQQLFMLVVVAMVTRRTVVVTSLLPYVRLLFCFHIMLLSIAGARVSMATCDVMMSWLVGKV